MRNRKGRKRRIAPERTIKTRRKKVKGEVMNEFIEKIEMEY